MVSTALPRVEAAGPRGGPAIPDRPFAMSNPLKRYLHSHSRTAQFLRFATVGAKVSVIDIGGTYLLPWLLDMSVYVARVISLGSAILAGYLLNRYFTFMRDQRGGFYRQMAGHVGVHVTGGLINYALFSGVMLLAAILDPNSGDRLLLPLLAIFIGGLVGMLFNYLASRHLVFTRRETPGTSS